MKSNANQPCGTSVENINWISRNKTVAPQVGRGLGGTTLSENIVKLRVPCCSGNNNGSAGASLVMRLRGRGK